MTDDIKEKEEGEVFCVFQDYLDRELGIHQELIGIFSTAEKALDEIDRMIGDGYYIEKWEIDV